jgi:glycine dehydrogenase subunit 2
MDAFVDIMIQLLAEAQTEPEKLRGAPYTMPVRRLDEVKAVKALDLKYVAQECA